LKISYTTATNARKNSPHHTNKIITNVSNQYHTHLHAPNVIAHSTL